MDARWLIRNVHDSVGHGCSFKDAVNILRWRYSGRHAKVGWGVTPRVLRFRFQPPVGRFRAAVRCNRGSDSFIFGEIFHHLYYDLRLTVPPPTILDLGANVGYTALFFSRQYPAAKIACVEPIPSNLACLKLNLELNAIKAHVFEAAIAPQDGTVSMTLTDKDYGHHVCQESGVEGQRDVLEVRTVSISTCMRELAWERVGLLKMDIEGYEKVLLAEQCEWLRLVDAICIECHGDYGVDDLRRLSKRWGFLQPERLPGIWLLRRKEGNLHE